MHDRSRRDCSALPNHRCIGRCRTRPANRRARDHLTANKPLRPLMRTAAAAADLGTDSRPLVGIIGDWSAIRAQAVECDQLADFLHDETAACERCGRRWHQPSPSVFDAEIRAVEGVLICEDCAGDFLIEAAASRGWTPGSGNEHSTHYARAGEVVG